VAILNKNKPTRALPAGKTRPWTHVHLTVFLLIIVFCLSMMIGATLYLFIVLDVPTINSLAAYQPNNTSYIYDDQGRTIARAYRQNRTVIPLSAMPELLPQAFVAAEDARFYEHSGVDAWSISRALIHNLKSGARGQGGSTITQQVARALLLTPEKTYTRKIKEAILAYRIDNALSKKEIIHIYLNQIYLGSGAYGVAAAAEVYFDKHVRDLNLAEISLLAGLPQAPSRYSPFRHFKLAKKRQAYVLNRMAAEGYITPTAARKAFQQTLLWGTPTEYPKENNYFIQHVKKYVEHKYGSQQLLTGGIRVYTTLDQQLQKAATMAIRRGAANWVIRQEQDSKNKLPQAALVAIEVKNGLIRAMVGGTNFSKSQFNRATQSRRQPGSAFKPIIYAAALENGMTPATMIIDEPLHLQGAKAEEFWEPQNFSEKFYGPTSLRNGLVYSRNVVTIKILQQIGVTKAIDLAKRLGITAPLSSNLSLALGSSGISPLELTRAYTAFANNGILTTSSFIKKITDSNGNILEEHRPEARRVMAADTAYQVTRLLEGVIDEGTGKSVRSIGIPAAGKTGTTDQNMDAWFIGYTPQIAAGVWVGHDQKIPLGDTETGGKAAAPIWLDFMNQAKALYPSGEFEIPAGIVILPINNETGQPGSKYDKEVSWEAFKKNQLPWPAQAIPEDTREFINP